MYNFLETRRVIKKYIWRASIFPVYEKYTLKSDGIFQFAIFNMSIMNILPCLFTQHKFTTFIKILYINNDIIYGICKKLYGCSRL